MPALDFQVDYGDGSRNRGYALLGIVWFLKAALLIPHLIAIAILDAVATIAAWAGYWAIALTGRQPDAISTLVAGTIRWSTRAVAWLVSTTDEYPPLGFDDGTYGARTTVIPDDRPRNRLLGAAGIIGFKWLLALPHLVALVLLEMIGVLTAWVGFVVIGFNGKLPRALHDFLVGVLRWNARVWAWLGSLTDEYPPFSLK